YNALAGELAGEVLNNTYYDGQCSTIRSPITKKLYRMASNLENITLELTSLEDDVTSQFYTDASEYKSSVSRSSSHYGSHRSSFNIPILFGHSKSRKTSRKTSFKEVIKASRQKVNSMPTETGSAWGTGLKGHRHH
ncbi:complement component C6-like, partial [Chiloscyllium plagiosum]|uniref:complement component C6-like n=1 Tax=Chiloscyllium plagiosum TaxID=36176 RepID=UPI001CB86C06